MLSSLHDALTSGVGSHFGLFAVYGLNGTPAISAFICNAINLEKNRTFAKSPKQNQKFLSSNYVSNSTSSRQ